MKLFRIFITFSNSSFRRHDSEDIDLLSPAPDAQGHGSLLGHMADIVNCATSYQQGGSRLEKELEVFHVWNVFCRANTLWLD